jgi:hypothetical protein
VGSSPLVIPEVTEYPHYDCECWAALAANDLAQIAGIDVQLLRHFPDVAAASEPPMNFYGQVGAGRHAWVGVEPQPE